MVFALAIENGFTSLVILAIITSLIGVYFYFRVIIAMFFKEPGNEEIPARCLIDVIALCAHCSNYRIGDFSRQFVAPHEIMK